MANDLIYDPMNTLYNTHTLVLFYLVDNMEQRRSPHGGALRMRGLHTTIQIHLITGRWSHFTMNKSLIAKG